MKLIIAGGRDYQFTSMDYQRLHRIVVDLVHVTEVVSGGASGADQCGEQWAGMLKIPVKVFKPDWDHHGKAAGPIRNREMAKYADSLALFPGGKGTDSMFNEARKAGLKIYDFRKNIV